MTMAGHLQDRDTHLYLLFSLRLSRGLNEIIKSNCSRMSSFCSFECNAIQMVGFVASLMDGYGDVLAKWQKQKQNCSF